MKHSFRFGEQLIDLGLAALRSSRAVAALFGLISVAAITQAAVVATPTFNPVAGTYTSAQNVTISTTTSGASIRYTTNGTTPSSTVGTVYTSPVNIASTKTLKAIAYKSGWTNSSVRTGLYTINLPDTNSPTVSLTAPPASATVAGITMISATASDNVGVAGVQFLLDGANLGTEDTSSPYSISWNTSTASVGAHTLTARARDAAGNQTVSAVVSVTVVTAVSVASDDFNRTNGALGANWFDLPDEGTNSVVSNNQVTSADWSFSVSRWAGAGTFTADQYSKITVINPGGAVELTVRGTGTMPAKYYSFGASGWGTWFLYKSAGGADIQLAPDGSFSPTGSDLIEFRAIGSTLQGYINGVLVVTAVDSELPTGVPGLNIYQQGIADNWEGGNLVSAGDTTPPTPSNGQPTGTLAAGTTLTTLTLTTNENATSRYSTTAGVAYASMANTFTTSGGTSHSTVVTGLTNGGSYTYYVRSIDAAGNATTADFPIAFSVGKATQATLSVNSAATGTFGAAYTATASGGSGTGALSWALGTGSTAPGAAINATTAAVTSTGAGTVVIKVTKATDTNYNAATSADFTVTLGKAAQATLSVNSSATGTFGTAYPATATGGSGTGALTWALGTGSTAPGAAINSSTGAVTSTGAGTVVIKVTKAADTNYSAATSADFIVTLGKAAQATLSVNSAASGTFGAAYTATATGGSGTGALTWALGTGSTAPGAAINGTTGAVTSTGAGTVVIKVTKATDTNYNAATSANFTVTLGGATQATLSVNSSVTGTFGAAYTATAVGGSGTGALTWALGTGSTAPGAAINATTAAVTSTGAGTVVIKVTKAGDANYNAATSADFTVTLGKAAQATLSVNSPATGMFGAVYTATASGGSGTGALSWALGAGSTAPGAAINAPTGAVTSTGTGTVVIKVTKATDVNYTALTSADFTITLGAADQTISFSNPGTQTYGTPLTLSATASSGLSVSYTVTSGPATVSGNVLTFTGAGSVMVQATQAGNASYGAATPVPQTLTVDPRPITVTLSGSKTYDGNTLPANASAMLTGGTLVSGDSITFTYANTSSANAASYTGLAIAAVTNPSAPTTRTNSYTINQIGGYTINPAGSQSAVSINSPNNFIYGDAYTATITGGSGLGTANWALGTGSTAVGAAIDQVSGVITANSSGTVVIKALRLGDTNFPDSMWTADYTVTVIARPILVTLSGSKIYDGVANHAGAQALLTLGTLASGDSISFSYADTSSANAGSYANLTTATVASVSAPTTRTGSYNISYSGNYTITAAASSGTVSVASPGTFLYGSAYTAYATGGSGTGLYTWALGSGLNSAGAAIHPDTGAVSVGGPGTFVIKAKRLSDDNFGDSQWSADFPVTVTANTLPTVAMSIDGTASSLTQFDDTTTIRPLQGTVVPIKISGADLNGDLRFVALWVNPAGPSNPSDAIWFNIRADGTFIDTGIGTDNSNPLHNALDSGGVNVSSLGEATINFNTLSFGASGYFFKIFAKDSASGLSVERYLTVWPTLNPNIITSATSVQGAVGKPFQYQIAATNSPSSFSVVGTLPPGLSLNPNPSGLITGTPTVPGIYTVTITASNPSLGFFSTTLTLTILPSLPYTTDFESPAEDFAVGNLNGQRGWTVTQGEAAVSVADKFHLSQSVQLAAGTTPAVISQNFADSGNQIIEYFDFFARPVAATTLDAATIFMVEGNKFAFLLNGSTAILHCFNGDGAGGGTWMATSFTVPVNASKQTSDWVHLCARLDFVAHKWDLYASTATDLTPHMVAADIPFYSDSSTYLSSFKMQGAATATSGLDFIEASPDNPLFGDANNNGIDDAWETAHDLPITANAYNSNRSTSPKNNGVTVVAAYVGGTDPNDIYNSTPPVLVVVGGDNQVALPGKFNAQTFDIAVYNAAGTYPLKNAPVHFAVTTGGGKLATVNTGNATSSTLDLATDSSDGSVQAYYQQPAGQGVQSTITFTAGGASHTFITTSAIDSNGDGIPDIWAVAYGLDPNDSTVAGAQFSGRPAGTTMTNLEAYESGDYPIVLALQNATPPTAAGGTPYTVVLMTPGNRIFGVQSDWQIVPLPVPPLP